MANNNNTTVDASIGAKVNEIKSLPYAKYIVSEDTIDRSFGYRIIRQQVSSGRNSVIYKCLTAKYGEIYCIVKAYKLGKEKVKLALKEETCQIMRFVTGKCPQLISTMDIFYTNEKLYLMSDWSARGDLLGVMKQRSLNVKFTEQLLNLWTQDILNGVNFLHSNGICHRNIAPSCLLLTGENRLKLGTLSDAVIYVKPGENTIIKQKWPKFSRTLNWNQGPEVAKGKLYDPRRADIWSIGATIYWFITRTHPIDYRSGGKMTKALEHRLNYMKKVSHKCMNFVKKLLTYQPSSRPTVQEALQLEWITVGISMANNNTIGQSASPTSVSISKQQQQQQSPDLAVIDVPPNDREPGEANGPEEYSPNAAAANAQQDQEASFGQANEANNNNGKQDDSAGQQHE